MQGLHRCRLDWWEKGPRDSFWSDRLLSIPVWRLRAARPQRETSAERKDCVRGAAGLQDDSGAGPSIWWRTTDRCAPALILMRTRSCISASRTCD